MKIDHVIIANRVHEGSPGAWSRFWNCYGKTDTCCTEERILHTRVYSTYLYSTIAYARWQTETREKERKRERGRGRERKGNVKRERRGKGRERVLPAGHETIGRDVHGRVVYHQHCGTMRRVASTSATVYSFDGAWMPESESVREAQRGACHANYERHQGDQKNERGRGGGMRGIGRVGKR